MISVKSSIRSAKDSDYDKIRNLWDACFDEDSKLWRDWYFKYIYKPQNTMLLINDNKLSSMIHINPYDMNLNKKKIKAAALSGVATYKDQRKKGYAGKLIEKGLIEMQKRDIAFSFLYPFNYDFYRKFGYELCYMQNKYIINSDSADNYSFEKINNDTDIAEFYNQYCFNLNGYILRDEKYMQIKLAEQYADKNPVYLILKEKEKIGYCMLEINNDKLILEELICENPLGVAKALSFKYKLPAEFENPDNNIKADKKLIPYCMGRVINVISVFKNIISKKQCLKIRITDDTIDENNNTYIFDGRLKRLKLSKTDDAADFILDIKDISQIALGYKNGMNEITKNIYELLFYEKKPWIKEVC